MNKRKKLICIITLILVVMISAGGYYFINRNNEAKNLSANKSNSKQIAKNTLATNNKKDNSNKKEKDNKEIKNNKDEKKDSVKDNSKDKNNKENNSKSENKATVKKTSSNNRSKESSKKVENNSFVSNLPAAKTTDQLIVVKASGSSATIGLYTKENGGWTKNFLTDGYVGYSGVGRKRGEGDGITPRGTYGLLFAFGINPNPGTSLEYRRVKSSDYWVDDPHSSHYNEWVDADRTKKDWKSAEKLIKENVAYKYAIAIDYDGGRGSAIFIHCNKRGATAGCVAMPQSYVIKLLKEVRPECKIVIL